MKLVIGITTGIVLGVGRMLGDGGVPRSTEHNSGAMEGNVTRVKHNGYGRTKFDLLQARILLTARPVT